VRGERSSEEKSFREAISGSQRGRRSSGVRVYGLRFRFFLTVRCRFVIWVTCFLTFVSLRYLF
jgi:hypothetical protein